MVSLPKVGQTRCYWTLLSADLSFRYLDPVLTYHLQEQAPAFLASNLLDFVHPDEQEHARTDLRNIIKQRGLHGSVTRVRYLRLSKLRERLGFNGPLPIKTIIESQFPDANKIVYDENYMTCEFVINWAADHHDWERFGGGVILCFVHAVMDLDTVADNDERRRTGWSNWCETPVFDEEQIRIMYSCLGPPPPVRVNSPGGSRSLQIMNTSERRVLLCWPPTTMSNLRQFENLAKEVSLDYSANAKTACQRRFSLRKPLDQFQVESIFIRHGTIIFACHNLQRPQELNHPPQFSLPSPPSQSYYDVAPSPYSAMKNRARFPVPDHHPPPPPPNSTYWNHPSRPRALPIPIDSSQSSSSAASSHYDRQLSYPSPPSLHHHLSPISLGTAQHLPRDDYIPPSSTPPVATTTDLSPQSGSLSQIYLEAAPRKSHPHHQPQHSIPPLSSSSPFSSSRSNSANESAPLQQPPPPPPLAPPPQGHQVGHFGSGRGTITGAMISGRMPGNPPPGISQCASCKTTSSPEWRKGPTGKKELCNACGLRYARSKAKMQPRKGRKGSQPEGSSSKHSPTSVQAHLATAYNPPVSESVLQQPIHPPPPPPPAPLPSRYVPTVPSSVPYMRDTEEHKYPPYAEHHVQPSQSPLQHGTRAYMPLSEAYSEPSQVPSVRRGHTPPPLHDTYQHSHQQQVYYEYPTSSSRGTYPTSHSHQPLPPPSHVHSQNPNGAGAGRHVHLSSSTSYTQKPPEYHQQASQQQPPLPHVQYHSPLPRISSLSESPYIPPSQHINLPPLQTMGRPPMTSATSPTGSGPPTPVPGGSHGPVSRYRDPTGVSAASLPGLGSNGHDTFREQHGARPRLPCGTNLT